MATLVNEQVYEAEKDMIDEVLESDESLETVGGKESKENISSILVTISLKCLTGIQVAIYSVTCWIYIYTYDSQMKDLEI